MKYRIVRRDPLNWAIERWQEGGQPISRGRYAGQLTQAKWDTVNPVGFYPTLAHAARRLLDEEIGNDWTGTDILEVVQAAEARVIAVVEQALSD